MGRIGLILERKHVVLHPHSHQKRTAILTQQPSRRRMLIMPVLMQLLIFPFAATLEVKIAHWLFSMKMVVLLRLS